ncbi:MAG: nucleotidyltransferase domain-containing protein [Spirochaetes bacterium]|nr:MAG: nucleotidyltransferase domain-containing protein [Spirochaetota bacterium]
MSTDNKILLQDIRARITDRMGDIVHTIILFGSRVQGTSAEHSDYDVLIVLRENANGAIEREIYDICYEIDLDRDILIDAKVLSVEDLATLRGKQPYIQHALETGLHI